MSSALCAPAPHRRGGPMSRIAAALVAFVLVVGCGGMPDAAGAVPAWAAYPAIAEGARMVGAEFTRAGADASAIVRALQPTDADYVAVFEGDTLVAALIHYGGYWESPDVIAPAPGQTDIRVFAATSEELQAGTGDAREFPSGYAEVAPHLARGLTMFLLQFSKPGEGFGVRIGAFAHVNGRWRIFPDPWAVLTVGQPGHHH